MKKADRRLKLGVGRLKRSMVGGRAAAPAADIDIHGE